MAVGAAAAGSVPRGAEADAGVAGTEAGCAADACTSVDVVACSMAAALTAVAVAGAG